VAVLGVGQELNGDDAAGVLVVRRLSKRQRAGRQVLRPVSISLLAIEGAHAPENSTGAVRRFAPDLVLLVDAAEMGDPPGTIRWLDWHEAVGLDTSTHALPVSMLARYLAAELSCDVALIGIQVHDTSLGAALSPAVRRAIRSVTQGLSMLLLDASDPNRPEGA